VENDEVRDLYIKTKAGDQSAFSRLYNEFHVLVKATVRNRLRRCRIYDGDTIEDIAQEAWLRAITRYNPDKEGSFLGFISTIARRVAINHCEAAWREVPPEDPDQLSVGLIRFPKKDALPMPVLEEQLRLSISIGGELSHRIVFAYGRLLGKKTGEIVEECLEKPLFQLVDELEGEMKDRSDISSEFIEQCFKPLRSALFDEYGRPNEEGRRTLASCFSGPDEPEVYISRWIFTINKRIREAIFEQEASFLRMVFDLKAAPHLLLHFGFVTWLRWDRSTFSHRLYRTLLREVEKTFEYSYTLRSVLRPEKLDTEPSKPILDRDARVILYLKPLRDRMDLPISKVVPPSEIEAIDETLLQTNAGETTVEHYYNGQPQSEIGRRFEGLQGRIRDQLFSQRQGLLFAMVRGYL